MQTRSSDAWLRASSVEHAQQSASSLLQGPRDQDFKQTGQRAVAAGTEDIRGHDLGVKGRVVES